MLKKLDYYSCALGRKLMSAQGPIRTNQGAFLLQASLKDIHERIANPDNVLNLLEEYQKLKQDTNESNRLEVEKLKLELIKIIEFNLKQDLHNIIS